MVGWRERERGREVGSSEAGFEALGISSVWSMYTCVRYLPLGPKSYPESERPTSKDATSLVETLPIGSDDTSSYMWCTPPSPPPRRRSPRSLDIACLGPGTSRPWRKPRYLPGGITAQLACSPPPSSFFWLLCRRSASAVCGSAMRCAPLRGRWCSWEHGVSFRSWLHSRISSQASKQASKDLHQRPNPLSLPIPIPPSIPLPKRLTPTCQPPTQQRISPDDV